jgi:hypothetical protein
MSTDQIRRVKEAIADCDKQIAREMGYSAQLRNQESIAFHTQHKAKLVAMLERA